MDNIYSAYHYQEKCKKSEEVCKGYAESINPERFMQKDMITNCITEIPQDIKLELNNGTLTLKAGSKVYVPNGFEADGVTPKFDVVIIESDLSTTTVGNNTGAKFISFVKELNGIYTQVVSDSISGATPPSEGGLFYDTTNNEIDGYFKDKQGYHYSLPLGIVIVDSNNSFASIDQVFNGFGYIGSTVFALPGVKGLIPNGRNADGTLKNTEAILTSVQTTTVNPGNGDFSVRIGNNYIAVGLFPYDEETNFNYNQNISQPNIRYQFNAGTVEYSSGKITSLAPKTTFHAVDYNDAVKYSDKAEVVGWNTPDYSAGISVNGKSGYTAPSYGVVILFLDTAENNNWTYVYCNGSQVAMAHGKSGRSNGDGTAFVPVKSGDKITVDGNFNSANGYFYPYL